VLGAAYTRPRFHFYVTIAIATSVAPTFMAYPSHWPITVSVPRYPYISLYR